MLGEICEIPLSAMPTVNRPRKIYSAKIYSREDLLEGRSLAQRGEGEQRVK
jgi:hypothetical protein